MPVLEFFPVDIECFAGGFAGAAIPAVAKDNAADIPEECGDAWHGRFPFERNREEGRKDSTANEESLANRRGMDMVGPFRRRAIP